MKLKTKRHRKETIISQIIEKGMFAQSIGRWHEITFFKKSTKNNLL
jgi:hypothetical protein